MKEIMTLFTSDDKQEIKNAVRNLVIVQIEKDIESYCEDSYFFYPDDVVVMVSDIVQELKEEFKAEIKKELMDKMRAEFEKIK